MRTVDTRDTRDACKMQKTDVRRKMHTKDAIASSGTHKPPRVSALARDRQD